MSNYFDNNSLSFSSLKNLQEGPSLFRAMLNKKPSSESLTVGNIVDCLLTDPESFDSTYLLRKAKLPTGKMLDYTNCLLKFDGDYAQAYKCSGFKQSETSVRENFDKECIDYYNEEKELKQQKKLIYTKDEYDRAVKVVDSLKSHPVISKCFIAQENEEIHSQLEIFWEFKKIPLKSKLDVLKINHIKKEITIFDLKTTGYSVGSFKDSIEKYQYWLQMVMYGMAVYSEFSGKILDIELYNIKFKWIVESTKYPGSPCIYVMSKNDENVGISGGKINGKYYKGFTELISDYLWYVEHNEWSNKREVIENNFEVDISIFN